MDPINQRFRRPLALMLCVVAMILGSVMPAVAESSPSAPLVFQFPLWVDGRNVGDLTASVQDDTLINVQRDRLLALLRPLIKKDILAPLQKSPAIIVTTQELTTAGLPLRYLPNEVRLDLQTTMDMRLPQDISLGYFQSDDGNRDFVSPSDFSAIVNSSVRTEYVHEQSSGEDNVFNPLNAVFNLRANALGVSGLNLDSDLFFTDENDRTWDRGQTTLFHDDVDTAVRYSAGDLTYTTSDSLQGFRNIGGLSVERRYSEIQPNRAIRSTGRGDFTLDRPAVVDVIVNGVSVRTVRLDPGQYSLRDLPFVDGLNDIELRIRDEQGRETTLRFSSFADTVLLDEGISEFSLNFGAASDIVDNEPEYDESNPTYSTFYRRGITSNLTLGASAQGDTDINTQGINAGLATLWGTFGASYALSDSSIADTGAGNAMTLDYRIEHPDPWIETQRQEFDLSYLQTSRDFSTLSDAQSITGPNNTTENEWRARFRQPITETASVSLGGRYAVGRDTDDQFTTNISLNEAITPKLNGYLNVEYGTRPQEDGRKDENEARIFATLTYRFDSPSGRSRSASSRYSSPNRSGSVEWQDLANDRNRVGSYDFIANAGTSESDKTGSADFGYTGNRYLFQANHETRTDRDGGEVTDQVSGATFQTALAYTGRHVAVGRPTGGAFAIVTPHKTLANNTIAVDTDSNGLPLAKTDIFGPALVTDLRTYSPSRLPVQVDDLPTGYDLGSGRYDLNPGARTGYALQVGSANSTVVIGRLLDTKGMPYALASGMITPEEGEAKSFFTNRNGRFVGEGLAPGHYTITLYVDPPLSTAFVIPEDSVGRIELGNLTPTP